MVRSWMRLRSGLIVLRHLGGRQSAAKHQLCIFCDRCIRNATVHALAFCPTCSHLRTEIAEKARWHDLPGDKLTLQLLGCDVDSGVFCLVLRWADELDLAAQDFWMGR